MWWNLHRDIYIEQFAQFFFHLLQCEIAPSFIPPQGLSYPPSLLSNNVAFGQWEGPMTSIISWLKIVVLVTSIIGVQNQMMPYMFVFWWFYVGVIFEQLCGRTRSLLSFRFEVDRAEWGHYGIGGNNGNLGATGRWRNRRYGEYRWWRRRTCGEMG